MKLLNKFGILGLLLAVFAISCSDNVPDREESPVMKADCQGIYFVGSYLADVEREPEEATQFTLTIGRQKTSGAFTYPIRVVSNENNRFTVPESVTFAAGEETTDILITVNNAEIGVTYELLLEFEGDDVNVYTEYFTEKKVQFTRIKWNPIGSVIFVDNIFTAAYGLPFSPTMYIDAERADLPSGEVRLRLYNVFNTVATAYDDEYDIYTGYPFNDPEDIVKEETTMLVIINEEEALMPSVGIGVDWGDDEMQVVSTYLLNTTYPKGKVVYSEDGEISYVNFVKESLYFTLPDYGSFLTSKPTYIFLTLDAYKEFMDLD